MLRKKKGQSTLEYIAVFTAVVAAILFFAYTKLRPAVNDVLTSSSNSISDASSRFDPSNVIP